MANPGIIGAVEGVATTPLIAGLNVIQLGVLGLIGVIGYNVLKRVAKTLGNS